MSVTGLNHYNLRAPRTTLDELRDFYVNVVGLQPGHRPPFNKHGYWLYAGSQAVLHLSEAEADETRPTNVTSTFDHAAFACTNMPEAVARLQQLNIGYRYDEVPLTGQRQLFFSDPAGNGVELNFGHDDEA